MKKKNLNLLRPIMNWISDIRTLKYLKQFGNSCSFVDNQEIIKLHLEKGEFTVFGESLCGADTSLLVEGGEIGLDAGYLAEDFPIPTHLFISHDHIDHIQGLPYLICRAIKEQKKLNIYISEQIPKKTCIWLKTFKERNPYDKLEIWY